MPKLNLGKLQAHGTFLRLRVTDTTVASLFAFHVYLANYNPKTRVYYTKGRKTHKSSRNIYLKSINTKNTVKTN